ncbi:PEGA domain-containing protein [Methanosarcina sp.]|uniref:PEGA domain-containing protein n=1 Tax=Methanosarcina sp. TaxID=2213 RepID=UPI003C7479B5
MHGIASKGKKNTIVRWLFGILFLLLSITSISSSFIAALLFLLAGIISIPPTAAQLDRKSNFKMSGTVRFFVVFIIVMFASAALPSADSTIELNNSTDTIVAPLTSANDTTPISEPASTVVTTPDNKGILDIETSPTGAVVTVDGVSRGLSPVKGLSVDEGKHVIDLYLSGYNPKSLTVYVTNSDTKTISWTFTPYVSPDPTPTETSEVTPTNDYDSSLVKNYDVIEENDISMKALTKSLSAYTTEELNSLPLNTRKEYRVVISPDVSKEELKSTLIQVVMDKTSANSDIDEVVVFAYDRKEDVDDAFTLGKVEWCPNGDWGSMTPEIASSNDRSSYQFIFDIKDKVGNVDASDSPTEREYEIYNYYEKCYDAAWDNIDLSDPTATPDEDLIMEEVAKKYGITKEEASRICDKVVIYKIS